MSSPRSAVLSADSDCSPAIPPRFVAFAWQYLVSGPLCSRRPDTAPAGLGGFYRGARTALLGKEQLSPPRFLGDPCLHALLSDPGGASVSGPFDTSAVAFRPHNDVGSARKPFEAQSHGLQAPCVRFAGEVTPAPRNTRFRWMANPYRLGTCTRRVAIRGF